MSLPSRIFLANVGVNAAHTLRSPLLDDGRFELLPIPEDGDLNGPSLVRYRDLRSFYEPHESLERFIPASHLQRPAHADPEFDTFTYGDNCDTSPRAAALRQLRVGDLLIFLARLNRWRHGRFTGELGFYLVGFLEIADVLARLRRPLASGSIERCRCNAHVRRALAEPATRDGFWVFCGGERSRRLSTALPLDRAFASRLFRDRRGNPWRWDAGRSALQVIGSYTRTCRCFVDRDEAGGAERAALLWDALMAHAPI